MHDATVAAAATATATVDDDDDDEVVNLHCNVEASSSQVELFRSKCWQWWSSVMVLLCLEFDIFISENGNSHMVNRAKTQSCSSPSLALSRISHCRFI